MGPLKGDLLKKELEIFTFKDLLEHYPFRHIDKTRVDKISSLNPNMEYAQVSGRLLQVEKVGEKRGRRLMAYLTDGSGEIELTWFQGINWVEKTLNVGQAYLVFGKLGFFMNKIQIIHPEIEIFTPEKADGKKFLEPIYSSTEKLKARGLNGRAIGKLTFALLQLLSANNLPENLPEHILTQYRFIRRWDAFCNIHFPSTCKNITMP